MSGFNIPQFYSPFDDATRDSNTQVLSPNTSGAGSIYDPITNNIPVSDGSYSQSASWNDRGGSSTLTPDLVGNGNASATGSEIAGSAIGAGVQVAGSVIQGISQKNALADAQKQSREIYDLERKDELIKNEANNKIRSQNLNLEKRNLKLQRVKQESDMRFNRWMLEFTKAVEGKDALQEAINNNFNGLFNNEELRTNIAKFVTGGGKQ